VIHCFCSDIFCSIAANPFSKSSSLSANIHENLLKNFALKNNLSLLYEWAVFMLHIRNFGDVEKKTLKVF